MLIFVQ